MCNVVNSNDAKIYPVPNLMNVALVYFIVRCLLTTQTVSDNAKF